MPGGFLRPAIWACKFVASLAPGPDVLRLWCLWCARSQARSRSGKIFPSVGVLGLPTRGPQSGGQLYWGFKEVIMENSVSAKARRIFLSQRIHEGNPGIGSGLCCGGHLRQRHHGTGGGPFPEGSLYGTTTL